MNRVDRLRVIPFLVSQLGWIVWVFLPVLLAFLFPQMHPAKTYHSAAGAPWNHDSDVVVFSHVTDIHLSSFDPNKAVGAIALFDFLAWYSPDFHLFTGDLIDGYAQRNWPRIGQQVPADWVLWRQLLSHYGPNWTVIDVPGNHEMWAIDDPLGPQNNFLNNSQTYNRSNTQTFQKWVARIIRHLNFTFVLINNYRFPSAHPPYIYWPRPTREMLGYIEDAVDSAGQCWLLMHYPVDYHWGVRSQKGHTFEQIVQKPNVEVAFAGHFHPHDPMSIHHGQGAMEFVGCSISSNKAFAIVTVDNGHLVYHRIPLIRGPVKFLVTHPVPLEQISSHQVFDETLSEVRVLSWMRSRVTINCRGAVDGVLKYARTLRNGADLYTLPLRLLAQAPIPWSIRHLCSIIRIWHRSPISTDSFVTNSKARGAENNPPFSTFDRSPLLM
jgi:hypothetical protein